MKSQITANDIVRPLALLTLLLLATTLASATNAQDRLPGTDAERAEGRGYAISLLGEDVVDLKQRVALLEDILSEEIEEQRERIESQDENESRIREDDGFGNILYSTCFVDEFTQYEYCAIGSKKRGFAQVLVYLSENEIGQRMFYVVDVPELYQGRGKVTQIFRNSEEHLWINFVVNDEYDVVWEVDGNQWHCVGLEPRYVPMVK